MPTPLMAITQTTIRAVLSRVKSMAFKTPFVRRATLAEMRLAVAGAAAKAVAAVAVANTSVVDGFAEAFAARAVAIAPPERATPRCRSLFANRARARAS